MKESFTPPQSRVAQEIVTESHWREEQPSVAEREAAWRAEALAKLAPRKPAPIGEVASHIYAPKEQLGMIEPDDALRAAFEKPADRYEQIAQDLRDAILQGDKEQVQKLRKDFTLLFMSKRKPSADPQRLLQ